MNDIHTDSCQNMARVKGVSRMLLEAVWSVFNHGVARVWSWCGQVWLGYMWCVGKHVGSSKFHGRVEFHGNELTWRWPFLFTIGCYVMIIFHWNLSHIFPKIPQTQIWPGSDVTSTLGFLVHPKTSWKRTYLVMGFPVYYRFLWKDHFYIQIWATS